MTSNVYDLTSRIPTYVTCDCKRSYSMIQWSWLTAKGWFGKPAERFEVRMCYCGEWLTMPVPEEKKESK